ncbi:MAG: response regulator [Candidatus Competibacter denitrificans]|jgi:CheY-like chemotaxis protein
MNTILIVEDCSITCDLIAHLLRKEGYRTFTANDGISGLKVAQKQSPDLAIIDLHLPDISGLEMADLFSDDIPFIALTMDCSQEAIRSCIQKGAFGYLVKPVDPASLMRHVSVAIQRGSDERAERKNNYHLRRALNHHQIIDKALGVLMGFLKISEPTAERALKLRSSTTNVRVLVLAEQIIEAIRVLGQGTDKVTPQAMATPIQTESALAFLTSFRKNTF